MAELRRLLSTIPGALAERLSVQEGVLIDAVQVEKIINRGFSTVIFIKVKTSAGDRCMVVKKTIHHPVNISITKSENQAVVEYNILSDLFPKFLSVPRCSVPRPILVMPEHESYVMDFVDGRLLGELLGGAKLFAPRKKFVELKEYYFLCGLWLKKLQEFTGVRRMGADAFSSTLERCEVRLKLIEEANDPSCPDNLTSRIRQFLDYQLSLVKDEDILVTGRHGDFGSWNIMAGPEGITVFDFLGYQDDLLPIDLLKMLMNFEIEKTYLFFSKKRIEALRESFLHGYGEIPRISKPILAICETLHRICSLYAIVTATSGNMRRRIERQLLINDNLRWLMSDNKKYLLSI